MSEQQTVELMLSLTVLVTDEATAFRVWELLGRCAAGIAFEGMHVSTSITPCGSEDAD